MRVTKGCPLCKGDVLGTPETGYYCKVCNLMFRKQHVNYTHVKRETKLLIEKHFAGHVIEKEEVAVFEQEPLEKIEVPSPDFLDKVATTIEKHVELLGSTVPPLDVAKEQLEWPEVQKLKKPTTVVKAKPKVPKKKTQKKAAKPKAIKKTKKSAPPPKKAAKKSKKVSKAPKKKTKKTKTPKKVPKRKKTQKKSRTSVKSSKKSSDEPLKGLETML